MADKTEELLDRWFEAQTTEEEERALRERSEAGELPDELRTMFEGFAALAEERAPGAAAMPAAAGTSRTAGARTTRRIPLWTLAAAATLIVGALCTFFYMQRPYCYIDGVAVYDKELAMQTTRYLDGFAAFESPDRMVDELIDNL